MRSPHYAEEPAFCEKCRIPSFEDLDEALWCDVLKKGLTVMFDYGGVCQCGRRTYLSGQSTKRIASEAKESLAQILDHLGDAEPEARELGPGVYGEAVAAFAK